MLQKNITEVGKTQNILQRDGGLKGLYSMIN